MTIEMAFLTPIFQKLLVLKIIVNISESAPVKTTTLVFWKNQLLDVNIKLSLNEKLPHSTEKQTIHVHRELDSHNSGSVLVFGTDDNTC